MPKTRDILSDQEVAEIQQPLDYKTGYSNPLFDKLYPETKNPWHGTERDIANRKKTYGSLNIPEHYPCPKCGGLMDEWQKDHSGLCGECFLKEK